ncbi:MAG: hypothetical protein EU532_03095 [Promethearchaeota archaeon]|nr:MAG: hypothetical protein EU532_03095 [Candidatus Lokiarchaeota archaeon]
MNSINQVFKEVLKEVIPTEQELHLIGDITENLTSLLVKTAKELNINYTRIEPQGSTGIKQTQLRNDFDIDLFIGLNYELYSPIYEGLSKNKLKKASKKDFLELCNNWIIKSLDLKKEFRNPRLLYAEHPYVTVDYIAGEVKLKVDIVLYFDLDLDFIKKNGPITAVDRSPWHGRFIRDKLNKDQKNDVRLIKQFFKACHSYGDKSAVGKIGFIGYAAELLIYYLGNIQTVFKKFGELPHVPLDYYKRNSKELNKIIHFQNDFLIIIDPIDMNRNVASAISEKAYKYCHHRIKDLIKSPNKQFFELLPIPEVDLSDLKDPMLSKIFLIELKNKDEEIHYTINRDKLYSLGDSIKANGEKEYSHAKRFEKIIFEVYFENEKNEYNLAIYCDKMTISPSYIRKGPPVKDKYHANKFKNANKNFFERDGYLWTETERKFVDFYEYLKDFITNKIPENLELFNISNAFGSKTSSGRKAIYVLKNMILPFYL